MSPKSHCGSIKYRFFCWREKTFLNQAGFFFRGGSGSNENDRRQTFPKLAALLPLPKSPFFLRPSPCPCSYALSLHPSVLPRSRWPSGISRAVGASRHPAVPTYALDHSIMAASTCLAPLPSTSHLMHKGTRHHPFFLLHLSRSHPVLPNQIARNQIMPSPPLIPNAPAQHRRT